VQGWLLSFLLGGQTGCRESLLSQSNMSYAIDRLRQRLRDRERKIK